MSANGPFISSTQIASSVPFDNTTGKGFVGSDVQTALEELRDHTIYDSRTQATTAAGTLTLTSTDANLQYLTGTAVGYNVQMPSATALSLGAYYQIINASSKTVQIKDGSGTNLFVLGQNSIGFLTLQLNGTSAGTWIWWQTSVSQASGIVNYNTISSSTFTTSSATDVAITSFSVTPQAGTYAIWYNAENTCTGSGIDNVATIYKGGSAIADSTRHASSPAGSHTFTMSTQTITQFDGSTACTVEVNTTGTLSVQQRSLLLIRLGT